MNKLRLQPAMLPLLLYQRTQYASRSHKSAKRLLGGLRLYGLYRRLLTPMIERSRLRTIAGLYQEELSSEFDQIRDHLPAPGGSILDIGCGLAGIDLFIHEHFAGDVKLHLLDKEGISEIYYGYRDEASHYNLGDLTLAFLLANGVSRESVQFHEVIREGFPASIKFDLVISLISWGFHYPVRTYLDDVLSCLEPGGRVIVAVRKATDGYDELSRRFENVEVVAEDAKRFRVVAAHPSDNASGSAGIPVR